MTKAQQTATATEKIESRIRNMAHAADMEALDLYDYVIQSEIFLLYQIEVITKNERYRLENMQIDAYIKKREELEKAA